MPSSATRLAILTGVMGLGLALLSAGGCSGREEASQMNRASQAGSGQSANLEKASGRGILLMRTFMDEVAYSDLGNIVTLTKNSNSAPALTGSPPG